MVGEGEVTTTLYRRRKWSPTAEQLMVLQELYRRGLRNPNRFQVRTIMTHLSLYGKVETKNVFYWFQNHKARDRKKLLRKGHVAQLYNNDNINYANNDNIEVQSNYGTNNCPMLLVNGQGLGFCYLCHPTPRFSTALCHNKGDEGSEDVLNKMGLGSSSCDVGNNMMMMMMTRMYGQDWRVMMMGSENSHHTCRAHTTPPQTLQLFPVEAADRDDDDDN